MGGSRPPPPQGVGVGLSGHPSGGGVFLYFRHGAPKNVFDPKLTPKSAPEPPPAGPPRVGVRTPPPLKTNPLVPSNLPPTPGHLLARLGEGPLLSGRLPRQAARPPEAGPPRRPRPRGRRRRPRRPVTDVLRPPGRPAAPHPGRLRHCPGERRPPQLLGWA